MREALAAALSIANLDEQEARERPVDRLHALASAQIRSVHRSRRSSALSSLGVSFIALKYSNRADELQPTIDKLAAFMTEVRPKPTLESSRRVARWVVMEAVIDLCPTCKGAGEIPAQDGLDGAQRMKECPECGGHGKRRYSNHERIEGLQIGPGELSKYERMLGEALALLNEAEAEAIRSAKKLLERW